MSGFLKRYADPATASEALRRTDALRRQGVTTPKAGLASDPSQLVFDQVTGQTGHDLIGQDLAPLLTCVAQIHDSSVSDLPVYDPLLRIRPRLALTDVPVLRALVHAPVPSGTALVHGDLHVGQFIVDPGGTVWVVDLDDLAIGPGEADLANLTAHLATTDTRRSIIAWQAHILGIWGALRRQTDMAVFHRFLDLALLRRHLKLRASGRPDYEDLILTYLRDRSSFSIR